MDKTKVHTAAFFAMMFWGFSYVWSKIVFEYFTPLSTVFFRLIISFITLFAIIIVSRKWENINPPDRWLFLVSALFNPFLYFIFESYGLNLVSASVSAFIIATIPVFTPFFAYKIFGEKVSLLNIAGLIISFMGILLIIIKPDLSLRASPIGVGLLFLAVASAVVYVIFLKKLSVNYKPYTIIAWQNLLGAIYFLPFFFYFDADDIINVQVDNRLIFSLLSLGIFASSFAYVLFTYVIRNIGISKGNFYANLIPVFAAIASYFVLSEKFTIIKITGMIIIILGVTLSEIEVKKQKTN
jgi:drug/metabolite transporter (DMT)-like permease